MLIVDDGRSGTGLWPARELARSGHLVGLASADVESFAARSRSISRRHPTPRAREDLPGFLAELQRIGGDYDVAIATGDIEVLALAAAESELPFAVGQPPLAVLASVLDKGQLTAAAQAAGIRTPRTWSAAELPAEAPDLLAVKPRLHWSPADPAAASRPTRLLRREAVESLAGREQLLAQEVVTGRLGGLVLAIDRAGRVVRSHQQVACSVFPVGAGNCVRGHTVAVDGQRVELAADLLRSLGFWGLAQLEYVESDSGPPALIDVNPRPYGSIGLAVAAGLAPSAALVAITLNHQGLTARSSAPAVRYSALGLDLRRAVAERRGGLVADVARSVAASRGAAHAVWSWDDPAPALRQWRRAVERALARISRRGRAGGRG